MMFKWIVSGALIAVAMPAQSATVVVAFTNSRGGGSAVIFGPVVSGQSLTVSSSTDDLWSAGGLPRYSDANGLVADRFATATDDSGQAVGTQIGANFGLATVDGYTAPFGSLVGRIGSVYQFLGANYNGTAWGTGNLELFYWDSNFGDNFGEITFDINAAGPVPEPATWALLILGFGFVGASLRSQRKPRFAVSYS